MTINVLDSVNDPGTPGRSLRTSNRLSSTMTAASARLKKTVSACTARNPAGWCVVELQSPTHRLVRWRCMYPVGVPTRRVSALSNLSQRFIV